MPPVSRLVRDAAGQWRQAAEGDDTAIAFIRERFPAAADLLHTPDRRQFMRLMAASLALSGLAGCDDDSRDEIVPPVNQAEGAAPGSVLTYASSVLIDGFANGVLVKTRDGRPIKIEGHPGHPWSRGGTDVFGQASVLGLYDPFRSQSVQFDTRESDWAAFRGAVAGPLGEWRANGGQGVSILVGPTTSPSLAAQLLALQRAWPQLRLYSHVPATRAALYEGTRQVFGAPLETHWRLSGARVIVSLDGDLLDPGPHQVGAAREWSDARQAAAATGGLLEMWAAGPVPNLTSAKADHPLSASPAMILAMAQWFCARASGLAGLTLPRQATTWCEAAWRALDGARGSSAVVAGLHASAELHACVQRLNAALGNAGRTVLHTAPLLQQAPDTAALVADMAAGRVQTLLMLNANPVYDAPADLDFSARLAGVKLKIHAGLYADETALNVDWHLPTTHPLECWGDAYALDGTACLIQPTIRPLYDGRSLAEIVSLFADAEPRAGLDLLRAHWLGAVGTSGAEARWKNALLSGVFDEGRSPLVTVQATTAPVSARMANTNALTLVFRPDPTVWDGSASDNAWLQELPKPISKIVWENAIGVGPGLAARQHLATGDVVQLTAGGLTVEGPVWISPGQADGVVSVTLGYGRTVAGQLSAGLGYNGYALRRADSPWGGGAVTLRATDAHHMLATTQDHTTVRGDEFVRVQHMGAPSVGDGTYRPPTLYPDHKTDGRAWGMVIDLDTCIGCNACVTACQSENNISVVGRDEVANGRWMHWLRVDLHETPPPAVTENDAAPLAPARFMPVPCMHCEQAPCEVGCPVEATLHDHEGLNLMVYNRCIGTRACSGYCPYKVRRFNYADYAEAAASSIVEQRNPDVTVRARGVMEKCTYCVQRIAESRARSDRENTPIRDGEVRTACQDACPTRAITFGDLALENSDVARAHNDPRRYALLGELNTRPRTTYLAARAPAAGDA